MHKSTGFGDTVEKFTRKTGIKTIVDHIGRTVLGVVEKDTKDTITLFNPVIIHVQPDQQTGQLQVQSFPYIFMEFLKDKEKNNGDVRHRGQTIKFK